MAEVEKKMSDQTFRSLSAIADNRICFDCGSKGGCTWASVPHGVFLCMDCAAYHRSLGTHISFVKSTTLDAWTQTQLDFMQKGGNARASAYFHRNGLAQSRREDISTKYSSRAASQYRDELRALVTGSKLAPAPQATPVARAPSPMTSTTSSATSSSSSLSSMDAPLSGAAASAPSSTTATVFMSASASLAQNSNKAFGLGAAKAKVSFDDWDSWDAVQQPQPQTQEELANIRGQAAAGSSRLKMEEESYYGGSGSGNSASGGGYYSGKKTGSGVTSISYDSGGSSGSIGSNSISSGSAGGGGSYYAAEDVKTRFAKATSISSDQVFEQPELKNERFEKEKYASATSLSSDTYFGREAPPADLDDDVTLGELAERISKTDFSSVKNVLVSGGQKLGEWAGALFDDDY